MTVVTGAVSVLDWKAILDEKTTGKAGEDEREDLSGIRLRETYQQDFIALPLLDAENRRLPVIGSEWQSHYKEGILDQ